MTRLQQARARRAKQQATQDALQAVLDNMVDHLPLQPSEVFLSIIEYGIEGLAAQRRYFGRDCLKRLVETVSAKHGLR